MLRARVLFHVEGQHQELAAVGALVALAGQRCGVECGVDLVDPQFQQHLVAGIVDKRRVWVFCIARSY